MTTIPIFKNLEFRKVTTVATKGGDNPKNLRRFPELLFFAKTVRPFYNLETGHFVPTNLPKSET